MVDYQEFRDLATELIGEFGNHGMLTLTTRSPAVYDPLTDQVTGGDETQIAAPCVLVPLDAKDIELLAGTLTLARALKAKVSADALPGITPQIGDRVSIPGEAGGYVVDDVDVSRPDGEPIAWTLYLGRVEP